ncbi:MAG: cohesin domain-containing protein [Candidatus Omnitrophica bacterium]|nr:cohesin domain-containing protein [Candidatus Omnitrophota bacterium]
MKPLIFSLTLIGILFMPAYSYALEISASDASFTYGEQASVILKFKDNPLKDVYAIDVAFDFNSEVLRLDRIDKGAAVAQFQKVENRKGGPGMAKVALIGLFPLNAGEGELLKLTFTALDKKARRRDQVLTIQQVLFSTDDTALAPEKIRQGQLIIRKSSAK